MTFAIDPPRLSVSTNIYHGPDELYLWVCYDPTLGEFDVDVELVLDGEYYDTVDEIVDLVRAEALDAVLDGVLGGGGW